MFARISDPLCEVFARILCEVFARGKTPKNHIILWKLRDTLPLTRNRKATNGTVRGKEGLFHEARQVG